MINWKKSWPDQWEGLPVDVLPASNGEYLPPPPTAEQLTVMHLQDREVERWRRKFGMSRRRFVRTSAATAIGFWAIDAVMPGTWGTYAAAHNTETLDACDLEWAGRGGLETLENLPGEFVFDIQSHHVDPTSDWRVTNPAIVAFFTALWPQSSPLLGDQPGLRDDGSIRGGGAGEIDPLENLSRFHYMKELYLDSATTMTVLSCVPTSPDTNNPLPLAEAALTVHTANDLAKSQRAIMHAFVMPNRGSAGMTQDQLVDPATAQTGVEGPDPIYFQEEMDLMWTRAEQYSDILGGWKTYCAWGDAPYSSGWWLDSDYGMRFLQNVKAISDKYPSIPPVVATHKGFSLPGFDQRGASPRDVGVAAKANPGVRFMIYHSGYDIFNYNGVPVGGKPEAPYAGDANVDSSSRTVDAFVKSLRENHWDASRFVEPGKTFGNVPNVWAELGSVWRDQMSNPDGAANLLGKLITHVGPKRIAWGTDSLWYGSPQSEIVALRRLQFTEKAKEFYNLPYGLDGDVEDPTQPAPSPDRTIRNGILGRNAAAAYNIDPDARRNAINCDLVNGLRKSDYIKDLGDPLKETAPMASNKILGARTRRQVLKEMVEGPWAP
jgi:predicted TIM-barrel fold metal-dependent hydrolase